MAKSTKYDIGVITDVGNKRKINQDSILSIIRDNVAMIAVADGMGGLQSGEFVSKTVIQGLSDWFTKHPDFVNMESSSIKKSLGDIVIDLNIKVLKYCKENNVQSGTTLTVALIVKNVCYYVYSGDTRLYLIRDNKAHQLSFDENLYAYMKHIAPDENSNRNKCVLVSYIGKGDNLPINIDQIGVFKDDILVVCSDGLYNYFDFAISDNMSLLTKSDAQHSAEKVQELVKKQAANDNLSMVILKYK